MRQPYHAIRSICDPFLDGWQRKTRYELSYRQSTDRGWQEIAFFSDRRVLGTDSDSQFFEVNVQLVLCDREIASLLFALQQHELDQGIRLEVILPDSDIPIAVRSVTRLYPFDPTRDEMYKIRFDHFERDVQDAFQRFQGMMIEDGFAWFARYADPLQLSRDMNDPIGVEPGDLRGHPLCGQHDIRAEKGIAAACIAEPERVEELRDLWLDWRRRDDEYRLSRGRKEPFLPETRRRLDSLILIARDRGYRV